MLASPSLPAILGGQAVRPHGPPSWPLPDEDVWHALQQAYRDGSWGQYHGPHVRRLGEALAAYHGVRHVVLCGSGTFAVELALRALQIGPGHEVILGAYDYPGNFLSVHAVGALPVLVDIDLANGCLDLAKIPEAISPATRAILVSHLHGGIAPMEQITALAQQHGLTVIEDAAQQPGALIQGKKAGTWGDVGILSFGGSKLLSAGRGGALLTSRDDVHQRARLWQQRGNLVNPLSELQAAVLLPQLAKLDARNAQRRQAVGQLADLPGLQLFRNHSASEPAYYKVGFRMDETVFGLTRATLVAAVRAEGIALDEGFRALHVGRSPTRFRRGSTLHAAAQAHARYLVLHHPVLLGTAQDLAEVQQALDKVWTHAEHLRTLQSSA